MYIHMYIYNFLFFSMNFGVWLCDSFLFGILINTQRNTYLVCLSVILLYELMFILITLSLYSLLRRQ